MTPNNPLSILPFYGQLSRQNHRKDYAFGEVFPLLTPYRKILPFQIIRNTRANQITSVELKHVDDTLVADIVDPMKTSGLIVNRFQSEGYDIIQYQGILPMVIDVTEGPYYLKMFDGVEYFYSEVFNVVRNLDNYLKLEYWDNEKLILDWGRIDYSGSFKFNLYLDTQLGRPEYIFEEEVQKRDGFKYIEKQISEKTFKFNFVAPEYLLDAMRLIRMSDNIVITNKGEVYEADSFLMTPKWRAGGYLASVECEFQCDTVIKKIGRGIAPTELGDFYIDYNDDFNIT
jgi:hypothetical protein